MKRPNEYWAMWGGGNSVCSKHKTLKAARAAANKCEKDARSSKHSIIQVIHEDRLSNRKP